MTIAISLKNTKSKTVQSEKYGEQTVINLGPSTGKFPRFNFTDEKGVAHTMLILPQPNEGGDGWHLSGIVTKAEGVKAPSAETFSTAKVAKTPAPSALEDRVGKMEAALAQILAAVAK